MHYTRALRILGIDHDDGLTRTTLRRIYLRKLKSHPPETDPDGFRDLREAFELVRERVPDDAEPRVAPAMMVIIDASAHSEPKAPVFSPPASSAPSPPTEPPRPPLPPLAPMNAKPTLTLPALVTKLLELLAAGLVDAARDLDRDWRATDDHREATGLLAARWSLLRELLGVAADLPVPVTKLLAKALAEGDLASARLSLIVYGREHAIEAELAADTLAKRAPNLFKPIENTLFVPRPKPAPPIQLGGVFGYGLDFMRTMADKKKR